MEKNKLGVGNSRTNRKINIRKQRSDKKVDIRVPASREEREFAQYQARIKRESMTSYCSNLVTDKLNRYYYFEDIPIHTKITSFMSKLTKWFMNGS
ncbi:hypothetical protein [Thalassobacillus sp. C254]|uniref:hypothetical protein n=1 Tax=Thalassobacillus sp. C254 TaxID=1225341 RepID=UPI0006D26754|nr:hypothetical protein [Thalassobacillus sp. C254]